MHDIEKHEGEIYYSKRKPFFKMLRWHNNIWELSGWFGYTIKDKKEFVIVAIYQNCDGEQVCSDSEGKIYYTGHQNTTDFSSVVFHQWHESIKWDKGEELTKKQEDLTKDGTVATMKQPSETNLG